MSELPFYCDNFDDTKLMDEFPQVLSSGGMKDLMLFAIDRQEITDRGLAPGLDLQVEPLGPAHQHPASRHLAVPGDLIDHAFGWHAQADIAGGKGPMLVSADHAFDSRIDGVSTHRLGRRQVSKNQEGEEETGGWYEMGSHDWSDVATLADREVLSSDPGKPWNIGGPRRDRDDRPRTCQFTGNSHG